MNTHKQTKIWSEAFKSTPKTSLPQLTVKDSKNCKLLYSITTHVSTLKLSEAISLALLGHTGAGIHEILLGVRVFKFQLKCLALYHLKFRKTIFSPLFFINDYVWY